MRFQIPRFALRHALSITFIVFALCGAGGYAALHMPSALFPRTEFPRVIIMVENGVMPADEMMATITRPIEEAMKQIPGCETIRSSTGRGEAEIDLFFSWDVDMRRSELYALGRLSEIRTALPTTVSTEVYRMNFSVFPIIGISLTGSQRDLTRAWELARYELKPQLLRIPGVARVDLVGGRAPEYCAFLDPLRMASLGLDFAGVADALAKNNVVVPAGVHQENHSLYLTVVDGRMHSAEELGNLLVPAPGGQAIPLKDFARVERAAEPVLNVVTANGSDAVLLNIYSQPGGSTLDIADHLHALLGPMRGSLPPGMKLSLFYDQSLLVRDSVHSVWEAIVFGLILSVAILYLFLWDAGMTLVATAVIPITVLITILGMKLFGQSFNLMTLGGIAAAIGLVIDDAIVVVEAIHVKMAEGLPRMQVIESAIGNILAPLVGSTLTPVVVFIPLAFLTGVAGVFFRALALTMVIALISSLVLALTITPSLAAWVLKPPPQNGAPREREGMLFGVLVAAYESLVRLALRNRWFLLGLCLLVFVGSFVLYGRLKTDFLPPMDEGGFIIDYVAPPGSSLIESDRQMRIAEKILASIPEVESYSRRSGTALGVGIVEPNTGDFLVKLKAARHRTSEQVIADVRQKFRAQLPRIDWEFPGILADLIGDLTWTDEPIEIKIFSTDINALKKQATDIEEMLENIPGVVDTSSGVIYTGPTLSLRVRPAEAQHFGLTASDIGAAIDIANQGQIVSTVLEKDRILNIRVRADPTSVDRIEKIRQLPIRTAQGTVVRLDQVADVVMEPGQLERERDNLRQNLSVTARLQDRDLGSAMRDVQRVVGSNPSLPQGAIEYGGLYAQQQESFRNLLVVLLTALALVFIVALVEFRSFYEPVAIIFGAALSVFGIILALLITGMTVNIVTLLGAIIGAGIVHKNGLLMLDSVKELHEKGEELEEAIVQAGARRLRPVLMTSLAAALGMLPLALGFGAVNMLKPLAIAVIGAVCVSVLLSLIATPMVYDILLQPRRR
ncbi:MAG TPA: efflux RND transporter permease subunit [Tepidisphaeraceae bacterium]|jgi:CzcA family heavy metal efflux pump|nr:efflux RND transporter permease subunit [Tepidisphaeraceae bacterium]